MDHMTEENLIHLMAGRLEGQEMDWSTRHIEQCGACRARYGDLRRVWDQLGAMDVEIGHIDLTDRVLAAVGKVECVGLLRVRTLWRVAASILVGLGVGLALAQVRAGASRIRSDIPVEVLAIDSPTGLTRPWLHADGGQVP